MKNNAILIMLIVFSISVNFNSSAQDWTLSGNSGTTPGTNFIGTSDAKDLVFKTGGTAATNERMRIKSSGNIGIGISVPYSKLHVKSNTQVGLTSSGIFALGDISAQNLVFDGDEIQARSNGSGTILYLNRYGGNLWLGKDPTQATSTPLMHFDGSTGNIGIGTLANNANRFFIEGSTTMSDAVLRCKVNYVNSGGTFNELRAISGISTSDPGFGVGVYGEGSWVGVYGKATNGATYSVGVWGESTGNGENWGGYFPTKVYASKLIVGSSGPVLTATGYDVAVDGKIICEELRVKNSTAWPDYVFDKNYQMLSIDELESSIKQNNHLPGIPTACEIEEEGILIGDMQIKMMEKIEEQALYIIDLNTRIKNLEAALENLNK